MKKYQAFLATLLLAGAVQAQSLSTKIETLVNAYHNTHQFNGSLLVAQHGTIIYKGGVGFKNAGTGAVNTENSIFQIGSVTKQFTSAVIMQLQQEGRLSVLDHLDKYLPGFPNGNRITIEQLLTHTSGLHNYTDDTDFQKADLTKPYDDTTLLSRIGKYALDFPPGTSWKYSNSGYIMLGLVIKKVTGHPYEQEVRRRIFQPLGMTHSGFDFMHLADTNKTQGYFRLDEEAATPSFAIDSTIAYSAGAIYTTVGDLYKWERGISANKILTAASWKAVFTPHQHKYGYGWGIDTAYGNTIMNHGGSIPGFFSYIARIPAEDLVVIAIDNSSQPKDNLVHALVALVLNQPYKVPAIPKETVVANDTLKQYVGEYELAPNFTLTITLGTNGLRAQGTGQDAFDLFAEKENLFFVKVVVAEVEFFKDANGAVDRLILYQNGQQVKGKKIK
jgi:CubicO group peptidase (beta-lactamase class C family)